MELNFSMPLVALEELLHVSGIFEPEKMVHHELMDLEMQVRPATESWSSPLHRALGLCCCWLCVLVMSVATTTPHHILA